MKSGKTILILRVLRLIAGLPLFFGLLFYAFIVWDDSRPDGGLLAFTLCLALLLIAWLVGSLVLAVVRRRREDWTPMAILAAVLAVIHMISVLVAPPLLWAIGQAAFIP